MVANSEYLARGLELVEKGKKVISDLTNVQDLQAKVESTEIDSQIKRFKGERLSVIVG